MKAAKTHRAVGVGTLYYGFRRRLREERQRIALLQLSAKLEGFLVHEFLFHAATASDGSVFGYTNFGGRGENKLDLCLMRPARGGPVIYATVEAKYFRNRHRDSEFSATDETAGGLKDLADQLAWSVGDTHGGSYKRRVQLTGRTQHPYGLVFVSHTAPSGFATAMADRAAFYESIRARGNRLGLRYHDKAKAALDTVYKDERIAALGREWLVSLAMGLWVKG